MNNSQSYLTFRSRTLTYGIEITLVKEILQLPELTLIPEMPKDIIGVLYTRDHTIPVMHLDRRLGQAVAECRVSDRLIIIQWQTIEMGIVVNEVLDVVAINSSSLEPDLDYGREQHINTAFIANIATVDGKPLILLNSSALIREPDQVIELIADSNQAHSAEAAIPEVPPLTSFFDLYCPHATDQELAIFRQRAEELQQSLETTNDGDSTMFLAVFSLNEAYLGCDLTVVKEFIDIDNITPIPGSPPHIVGNINLRGEIITLIDIRSVLNFAAATKPVEQAILMQIEDISAAIVVDEIFDVYPVDQNTFNPIPTGVATDIKKYFYGMTKYQTNFLNALNISKIFTESDLAVS